MTLNYNSFKDLFSILYEDQYIIVTLKRPGLLVIPDRFKREVSLRDILREIYNLPIYTVHRIDRGTAGIVLFAKDLETHRALSIQFQKKQVTKRYLAIIEGILSKPYLNINLPIRKLGHGNKYKVDKIRGKPAMTRVMLRERFENYNYTLVEIEPVTGKSHQIRVHLAYIGYPLAIDYLYNKFPKSEKFEEIFKPLLNLSPKVLSLHSYYLKFRHPYTKRFLEIKIDPIIEFQQVISNLSEKN